MHDDLILSCPHVTNRIMMLQCVVGDITKTCLYNVDPLKPHFYKVKLRFTGVNIIFLISAENIDCGYSLEPPLNNQTEYRCSNYWVFLACKRMFFFLFFFSDQMVYYVGHQPITNTLTIHMLQRVSVKKYILALHTYIYISIC